MTALAAKYCVVCGGQFEPLTRRHSVCSERCAIDLPGHKRREALRREWARDAREQRRAAKSARSGAHGQDGRYQQARIAINEFVRERDHDLPCIVTGKTDPHLVYDAGHFIPVQVDGALRFNLWNIHKQVSSSNRGAHFRKRRRDTTGPAFEANLRARIGDARVDWLKGPHPEREYSDEYLARLASIFRRRAKLYRRIRDARDALR